MDEMIQIVDNATGRVLFTLSTAAHDTYKLTDGHGLERNVSIFTLRSDYPTLDTLFKQPRQHPQ